MARSRDIFIRYADGESEVVRAIGEIVGQALTRKDTDGRPVYFCRVFDVDFTLVGDHGIVDDCGIEFTRYQYELMVDALGVRIQIAGYNTMYEGMTTFLTERLSVVLQCETLLVENLQHEVAVFRP